MKKIKRKARARGCKAQIETVKARVKQAEARAEQAQARTEQAKTRAEAAETRTEQAETRIEAAKTRAERAETRAEQAETRSEQVKTVLQEVVEKEIKSGEPAAARLVKKSVPAKELIEGENPIDRLTARQREILQCIAKGQNTKQIADILGLSPKTIEYHRQKLMAGLNVHDIPALVRLALRAGLIPLES